MNTIFLLMAQYESRPVVTLEEVCKDYFQHLTPERFVKRVMAGTLKIPVVRIDDSQKGTKGVHIQDLADYLDACRAAAKKELEQLHRP